MIMTEGGKISLREIFPSVNLSATHLTCGLSPCLVCEVRKINGLSRGAVQQAPTVNWMVPTEHLMTVGAFSWCEGTDVLNFKWYESQLAPGLGG